MDEIAVEQVVRTALACRCNVDVDFGRPLKPLEAFSSDRGAADVGATTLTRNLHLFIFRCKIDLADIVSDYLAGLIDIDASRFGSAIRGRASSASPAKMLL